MITFQDYKYQRPKPEEVRKSVNQLLEEFKKADSVEKQIQLIKEFNKINDKVNSMFTISNIRHDVNTLDKFYEEENSFWDEFSPELLGFSKKYAELLLNSKFRKELEERFGKQLFTTYELKMKIYDESIAQDMVQENKLVSQYHKLVAIGKVDFQGKKITLNDLTPFREDRDAKVRKEANEAYFGYFADNVDKFDKIYDELVKLRHKMAKKLGYENFIQMAYDRMERSDYSPEDIAGYRKQIYEVLVPITQELRKREQERLGIEKMHYYDYNLKFLSGNAIPKGDPHWIMENGKRMYEELGKEAKEFFDFMSSRNLFDVLSREGKKAGGYCTYIQEYESPFIFANFNGTSHDVDVLTHEAGHAFQVYKTARKQELSEYLWPSMDAAEIHSMSMEFLTWPWMDLFFKEDADKYRFSHISSCVEFIPYGASIDEFQHEIYLNPDMSPEERRNTFRKIEKKYLPHIDYGENEFLESGGFFFRQLHIFSLPFYYIDYTLAQICALQFWKKSEDNREKAMEVYIRLCESGGSKPFLELLKIGELMNPFEEGSIKATMEPVMEYINSVDDKKL